MEQRTELRLAEQAGENARDLNSILLSKLTVFEQELVLRDRIATTYDRRLGNAVTTPARVPDSTSAWAVYSILTRSAEARTRTFARRKIFIVSTPTIAGVSAAIS